MIGGATLSLALLVAVTATMPHLLARDSLRYRLVRLDAISTISILAMWHVAATLEIDLTPSIVCGAFLAIKILLFFSLLASSSESPELEWSAGRAAIVAGLVYLALIPSVLEWPIDGDEAFYVLSSESILRDLDLDLRNQYDDLGSSITGRTDLRPQMGDPVGPNGELYSRHEPLLSLLLLPGIMSGGLLGAVATIALLAALAIRAIVALLDEEGVGRRAQLLTFAFIGLAPPLLSYAVRIWPEAPGALLLAEMVRAARGRKIGRVVLFGILLSALKLRFIPVAVALLLVVLVAGRVRRRAVVLGLVSVAAVFGLVWFFFPGALASRVFDPRGVFVPDNFARGFLGILIDGQAGLLFQAPMLLLGLGAILRWRDLTGTAKLACLTALPYLVLLLPRSEWHGGWSPPLRYLVVFAPVFAMLVAVAVERFTGRGVLILAGGWTAGLAAFGVAFPPGLFRIASGESAVGEHLSRVWGSDFSRLIPSLIRPNGAALWFAIALLFAAGVFVLRRRLSGADAGPGPVWTAAVLAFVIAGGAWAGLRPGVVVEFEDSHVKHQGGELYPERWTVARFRFSGGWTLLTGDEVSFAHAGGPVSLAYYCDQPTVIEVDGVPYDVPTGSDYSDLGFVMPRTPDDRHEIRCTSGALIIDRLATQ